MNVPGVKALLIWVDKTLQLDIYSDILEKVLPHTIATQ